jgi:hypothetical protein
MEFLPLNGMVKTIIANLIGGIIFYFVDKKIFKPENRSDKVNI